MREGREGVGFFRYLRFFRPVRLPVSPQGTRRTQSGVEAGWDGRKERKETKEGEGAGGMTPAREGRSGRSRVLSLSAFLSAKTAAAAPSFANFRRLSNRLQQMAKKGDESHPS